MVPPAAPLAAARPTGHRALDAFLALALAAGAFLLHAGALDLYWLDDDFFALRLVAAHAPADYFGDREVLAALPNRLFTPLLFASLDGDLALFGLRPRPFYAHQLLALALATAALYATVRRWLSPAWAALAAALFALGPPTAAVAASLGTRHYAEAVLLGILSVATFAAGSGRGSWPWLGASAALYGAAMLAKEIAIPLLALYPLLAAGGPHRSRRQLLPHAAALGGYLVARVAFLGGLGGGYGWAPEPGEGLRLAAALPLRLAGRMAGDGAAGWVGLAAGAILVAIALRRRPRAIAGLALLAILAAAPILPVASEVAPRYALAGWLLYAIAVAWAGARLHPRAGGVPSVAGVPLPARAAAGTVAALAAAAVVAAALAHHATWGPLLADGRRAGAENAFLAVSSRPGDLLWQPSGPPATHHEAVRFRRELLGRPPGGDWLADELPLCGGAAAWSRFWGWDGERRRVIELGGVPAEVAEVCGRLRPAAPLAARFAAAGGVVRWRLGPADDGSWSFVLDDGRVRVPVPAQGGFRLARHHLALRVRYQAPAGWVTYSEPLAWDLVERPTFAWRRREGRAP